MSFISSVISGCTVMKHYALLPVMLVTVRPRDLSLKCDGERYLDERHKKNVWPKEKGEKTRRFRVCTSVFFTETKHTILWLHCCHNNWSLWLNATLSGSNYVGSAALQMTTLLAHLC
jgi:hypothetical protein